MDVVPTWIDCDIVGDYIVPNVLSRRDLVSMPDNMHETVPHIRITLIYCFSRTGLRARTPDNLSASCRFKHTHHPVPPQLIIV